MTTAIVLEDDALSAMALSVLLEDRGFTVYSAYNSNSAIEILEHGPVDLLVADWNLRGEGDSLDVAKLVRQKNPQAQVVFVTGYPEDQIRPETEEISPCAVFQKPLNYDSFFAEVLQPR